MAFEPFGYRFEIKSSMPPSGVKAAIRLRGKGWFDPKKGARGWVLGSVVCIWFSAFDRYGPMLIGRISRDHRGTVISGRAGSDLNGLAVLMALLPVMCFIFYQLLISGDYTGGQLAVFGGVFLLIPWLLWRSHKDRKEAEPLVRFLRDTVGKPGQSPSRQAVVLPTVSAFPKSLTLNCDGSELDDPATPESVHEALRDVADGGFVILALADEAYMQTVGEGDGYIVEKREGDDLHHYQAMRRGPSGVFSFDETLALFLAYGAGAPMPSFVEWKKIRP